MTMDAAIRPVAGSGVEEVTVMLTGEETFPAMEKAFLEAEREIWASYRVFDLSTRLRSAEGKEIGETWFELLVHVLGKGVAVNIVLSDFDPILGQSYHAMSWRTRKAFAAAREIAGSGARLKVANAQHPARVGMLPRLLLWPAIAYKLHELANDLNALDPHLRRGQLRIRPGLVRWLRQKEDGTVRARVAVPPTLVPGTHHQKMAVFDRSLLCIGGLDLDERRFDTKGHHERRDRTWHDVQLFCRGPVVAEAQEHLETFLDVTAAVSAPPRAERLLRTLSGRRSFVAPFLGPKPLVSELAEAHRRAVHSARETIYLETQFFRDRALADELAKAAAARPDLGLILILPAAPETVAFVDDVSSDARYGEYVQVKCIDTLTEAFGDRAAFCSPVKPKRAEDSNGRDTLAGSSIIYVHAKVSIFDDTSAIVSSANLNGRSLYWDTEAGVRLDRRDHVEALRRRTWAHWLAEDADPELFDVSGAALRWRRLAAQNQSAEPANRDGFLVPYDLEAARRIGRNLPFVSERMV